jgi:peptide/nickel transport system substrate-binding protein
MKRLMFVLSVVIVFTMVLSACAKATEAPAATAVATAAATAAPVVATTAAPAASGGAAADVVAGTTVLPRNETLYFNGQQWGSVVCWNPYSISCNNAMAIAEQDNARVTMFETPYLYDMLDGKVYPLLADGPYAWDAGMTKITFKLKAAAKWSDGTAVTADDMAYTWATHVKYNDNIGAGNLAYIKDIVAVDPATVEVQAVLGTDGKAVNPLMVQQYLSALANYLRPLTYPRQIVVTWDV